MLIERLDISLGMSVTRLVSAKHKVNDGIDQYTSALFDRVQVAKRVPVVFGCTDTNNLNGLPLVNLPSVQWSMLSGILIGQSNWLVDLKNKFDLLHATDHWIPRLKSVPVVATIHDAVPLSHPHWVKGRSVRFKSALWRASAKWAQHIITDSEYSKIEIIRHFGISEKKISVVPLGVNPEYFESLIDSDVQAGLMRFALPDNFFLFIGTIQPRKNLERIVAAHLSLPMSLRKSIPLVIVGSAGWGCESLVSWLSSSNAKDECIYWFGTVCEAEKRALLKSATALIFPTLLEGFGLPVLEAFASRTPVITSNVTSLPEVASDAALLVDPLNTAEIADAMKSIAVDEALCKTLVAKGLNRAVAYTWDNCARKTESVYAEVLRTY